MRQFEIFRRAGQFSISREMIETDPVNVMKVLSECLIVRAECQWSGALTYTGFSMAFEPSESGTEAGVYVLAFTAHPDGSTTHSWARIK